MPYSCIHNRKNNLKYYKLSNDHIFKNGYANDNYNMCLLKRIHFTIKIDKLHIWKNRKSGLNVDLINYSKKDVVS